MIKRKLITPGFYSWYYAWWTNIPLLCQWLKAIIIRGLYGWSYRDIWSFDDYLSKVMSEGLSNLDEISHGYPSGTTPEEWHVKLTKWAQILNNYHNDIYECDFDKECQLYEDVKKTIAEMSEFFGNLWD